MSSHCVCCGSPVPDGQRTCSMCYGDPYHGRDGYYLRWIEEQQRTQSERDYEIQRQGEVVYEYDESKLLGCQ